MDIGEIQRIVKVSPEPLPMGHPENAPEELPAREPVLVPVEPEGVPV